MTITADPYWKALAVLGEAGFDFTADTLKCMLVEDGYTPDLVADEFIADVDSYEASGTGYTAGGEALTTVTWSYQSGVPGQCLAADPTEWTTLTSTFRYAVVYKDTGTPATSPLLVLVDFGSDQVPSAVNVVITWDADGVLVADTL